MSDDLDFDMEVVGDDELDEMGAESASSSERSSRFEKRGEDIDATENSDQDTDETKVVDSSNETNLTASREVKEPNQVRSRLSDLPDSWSVNQIREVAEVIGGSTPSTKNEAYWGGDIPWATPTDVTGLRGTTITETEDKITEEGLDSASTHILPSYSVLMTSRATIGACAVNTVPMTTNQGFQSLVPGETLNTWYLFYRMLREAPYLESLGAGSTFSEVSKRVVEKVDIAVPPLPEQRKIASVLYAVDQAIQKTETIIEQAKRVKRGLMQDLFETGYYDHSICVRRIGPQLRKVPESWDVIGIGELAEYQNGYGFSKDEWSEQGRPIIRIQDLTRPEESDVNYFDGQVDEKYEVENGDILVSWSATLGVFNWSRGSAVLNQHIFKVRNIKEFVNERYLYYALNYALSELERKLHGSTMKHVTRSAFENTEVPLPGLDEQKKISRVIGSVDEEIRTEEAKKQNLEQVKEGLMQDLLNGEVRTADKSIDVLDEVVEHG